MEETYTESPDERVRRILAEVGAGESRVFVTKYFPGIASVPILKAVVASDYVVNHLSDEELKAILAHEAYHLSMMKDKSRIIRNLLLTTAAYLILVDVFLGMLVPYILIIQYLFPNELGLPQEAAVIAGSTAYFGLALSISTRLSRNILTKLMRFVPFGIEELEASKFAEEIVGSFQYRRALWRYSIILRRAMTSNKLLKILWSNSMMLSEAINPHPLPREEGMLKVRKYGGPSGEN